MLGGRGGRLQVRPNFFVEETKKKLKGEEKSVFKSITCGASEYQKIVLEPFFDQLRAKGLITDNKLIGKYFAQDGAPCHTASLSLEAIDENIGLENCITKVKRVIVHNHILNADCPYQTFSSSFNHIIIVSWLTT